MLTEASDMDLNFHRGNSVRDECDEVTFQLEQNYVWAFSENPKLSKLRVLLASHNGC